MNVDKPHTPEALCNRKMLVPIYQRLFVWDEDRIRKLLEDLFSASKNAEEAYYIGNITVHEKNDAWEIVDGQQRLTFLTLLACALNMHGGVSTGQDGLKTWNDFVHLSERGNGDKIRISYVGRSGDEDIIRKWWNKEFTPAELSGSFGIFYNVFEKFLNDLKSTSPSDGLKEFGNYCFKKVKFLVNCLPEEYGPFDLNLYFEKMNSTGKQLEPIDVVKGKWFSDSEYVGKFNMCMNFDKTYADHEKNYQKASLSNEKVLLSKIASGGKIEGVEDDATEQSSLENRLPMKSEVLLLHALKLSLERREPQCQVGLSALDQEKVSYEPKFLIKTFSDVFAKFTDEDKMSFKQCFINDLIAYRKWIDDNVIFLKGAGQSYDYGFRAEGESAVEEFLVERRQMIQFQSMLYVASGEDQRWVLEAYRRSEGEKLTLDILKTCGVATRTLDEKKLSYHTIDRYWFWRLDYELWNNMVNEKNSEMKEVFTLEEMSAILHYRFRRNRSIEHLHPQSGGNDEWGTRDKCDSPMHQFGNLAMMSVEGNSAQSNDGIGTKFGRVKDWISSGRLESIKMLLMFKIAEGNENKWTVKNSESHAEKMIAILRKACCSKNENTNVA